MKTTRALESLVENRPSGPEMAQSGPEKSHPKKVGRLGKTHQDYWKARLLKRSYAWNGKQVQLPDWQCRIAHLGRREWFNLDTPNKDAAALKAREIYLSLISAGWQPTLKAYKPDMEVQKDGCTVGDFLAEVQAVGGIKPGTFEIYARKFRSLVARVFHLEGDKKTKSDYVGGGHKAWLEKVQAVRLDKLTPEKVNAWKLDYLKAASKNPLTLKRANVTVRSVLLSSKSLFSPKVRRHLTLRLPSPLPFDDVTLPEIGRSRYKSEINPQTLLMTAKRELADAPDAPAPAEPKKRGGQKRRLDRATRLEMFKVVLLALGAGLRRDEIDTLTWKQLDFGRNTIRVETNVFTTAKSAESENEVDVDPGLMAIFRGYMDGCQSEFVIQSTVAPRPASVSYHHYRCHRLFRLVNDWLHQQGITSRSALHTLRKEFGSQIAAQAGIFAASLALRHSSITLTRDYYLDKKQPAFLAVSKLMQEQPAAQETAATAAAQPAPAAATKAA